MSGPFTDKDLGALLDAVVAVSRERSLPAVLTTIVETATELAGARYGALGVLDEQHEGLAQFITVGVDDDVVTAIGHYPQGLGLLGTLIAHPEPIRLDDISSHPDRHGWPPGHPTMTTFLGVPIRVQGEVFGNLYLCDKDSGEPFTERDEQLVAGLASTAGVAIGHARLGDRVAELGLLAERERIARDLHDSVIQRIFATGLVLDALASRIDDPEVSERLQRTVEDLDDTVRHIRTTIFELQRSGGRGSFRAAILDLAEELGEALEARPQVVLEGQLDTLVDADLADETLAVAREALTNVIRHARAHRVEVRVAIADGWLHLHVEDDGIGLPPDSRDGHGLPNLAARAERLGGRFRAEVSPTGGTHVSWQVPVDPVAP